MRYYKNLKQAYAAFVLAAGLLMVSGSAEAQNANAVGNFLGLLAQAGTKSNVLKQWQAQDAQVIQCINIMYSSKNITADSFVASGVGPNDQRVAPVIAICKAVMTAQPKTNFPCNVTDANGQQVASTCSESYAVSRNGSLVAVSRDDFLRAAGNGEQVQVANFETAEANAARIGQVPSRALVQTGGEAINWTKVLEDKVPAGGYRYELYYRILAEADNIKKIRWVYNYYPIYKEARSHARIELLDCSNYISMTSEDEYYPELWGLGKILSRTTVYPKSAVMIYPVPVLSSELNIYKNICASSSARLDVTLRQEWARADQRRARAAEENRALEIAKAMNQARGYALVCSGKSSSQHHNLNIVYVNCNNPQDAITKMSWAYNKITTEKYMPGGESFASMCLSQINQLRGMMGNTRYTGPIGDISSYNFLDVCNSGLQRVSDPSAAQARPRK